MLSLSELQLLARIIPRDTLAFRLSLLGAGCAEVNSRLGEIDTPVFIFAGGADLLVQSGAVSDPVHHSFRCSVVALVPVLSHFRKPSGGG